MLLNITPDHVDWHGSIEAYAADKARIFANLTAGDTAVVDVDDPGAAALVPQAVAGGATLVRVSRREVPEGGAGLDGAELVVSHAGHARTLLALDELRIRGDHNVSNALAAAAAAIAAGADPRAVAAGLRTFEPIEHRLEPVGVVRGVTYVNDSKATNPEAVLGALSAFEGRRIIVLLGGRGKGTDLAPLARACRERCELAVLFGESRPTLAAAFDEAGARYREAPTMHDAVEVAEAEARPGDVVLLSPACASFDEFVDFEDRGRAFKEIVAARGGER